MELRPYFFDNYTRINLLFKAVADTINECARKRNKGKKYTPGFVCTLHTYGRDLKFNPHIHVLLAETYLDKHGRFIENDYFNFEYMRKAFRTKLLIYLQNDIQTREFNNLSFYLKNRYNDGFYVNMPKNPHLKPSKNNNKNNIKKAISYVVRYVGKPCIANSRIIDFDEATNTVTFIFQPHDDEDDEWKQARMHVYDFIYKLIAHIQRIFDTMDEQFKMIRYYGFYSANNTLRKKFKFKFKHLYSRKYISHLKNVVYKCQYMLMHYFDHYMNLSQM